MGERGLIVIKMDKLSDNRVEAYKKVGSTAIFIVICVVQIVNAFIDITSVPSKTLTCFLDIEQATRVFLSFVYTTPSISSKFG